MEKLDRKRFLRAAGAGSVAAAGLTAIPLAERLVPPAPKSFTFRATAGLPRSPLPSYATHIVEGSVDLASGSGLITSRVLAGHPDAASPIGLPGLGRVIRITAIDQQGEQLLLHGLVEDRSQLRRGESAKLELLLDRKRGSIEGPFLGRRQELKLAI